MDHLALLLSSRRKRPRLAILAGGGLLSVLVACLAGCASPGADGAAARAAREGVDGGRATGVGTWPTRLDFLYSYDNVPDAPYFPLEGPAGLDFALDGSLYVCDEKAGRVHGLEPSRAEWFLFDDSQSRPYRPVDVRVDGFSVLVLDMGARLLIRFDMNGRFQDRLLSFRHLDAVPDRLPTAFDVDRDGRVVCTDAAEDQVLILDSFLSLTESLGEPGPHREQFAEPSGITFLPNGGFAVADRGNRRLQIYNRLGYFERILGGEFDLQNPMITPQGVDCDQHGNLFVADPARGAIHVFSRAERHLFSAGQEMGLLAGPSLPVDVAVGPDDLLAVSDQERQAILVYRIVYE